MLNEAAREFLTVDASSKKEKRNQIFHLIRRHRPLRRMGRDMVDAVRAFM
jgi:hypothetical protein